MTMTELYIPEFLPEEVKQRIIADKAYILKYQELSDTDPNWNNLTQKQREQQARAAIK